MKPVFADTFIGPVEGEESAALNSVAFESLLSLRRDD
jgi:hypothetical protein